MADEKKYIEREAALRACDAADAPYAKKLVSYVPAADVRPVVRGRWIEDGHGYQTCSNFGAEHHWLDYRADFCDECGADMREATQ